MTIHIINGPNLNLLGKREPHIYGSQTFEDYFKLMVQKFSDVDLQYFQSNSEGGLLDYIHQIGFSSTGIVLNAGAYTHTSVALADAIAGITSPVIEVHISNVHKREAFRHHSYISPQAAGIIIGMGLNGYDLAVQHIIDQNKRPEKMV
ncbi:type II 3-dehydroquinate dehydratase [Chondrinema litorale]|uniref:type II 3-dehydroquinate dehydratase n=1 Tax=Chondrinema litorale TaxID=2994555 RepID=UPI002544AAA6|nr:type II 3-dehydroquinate dehydratase [Chondrinema litorale]UZR94078.1 type II 3-dehydroquinate dehydratase [Chondrinema litorale]